MRITYTYMYTCAYRWPTPRQWVWRREARTMGTTTWAPPLRVHIHALTTSIYYTCMHTCYTHLGIKYSTTILLLYYTTLYYTIYRLQDHQHYPQPCRRTDSQCPIRLPLYRTIRPYLFRQTCCFTGTILHFTTPYGLGYFRSLAHSYTYIVYMYVCTV